MSNEILLRSVIREMVLREALLSPSQRDMAETIIDRLNIALGALDLVAAGSLLTPGAPIGAVWLKASGVVSGVINAGSMVLNLTEEPPDLQGAAIDLVECIVSILTIGLAGRAAGMGLSAGLDVAQAVVGIIEGATGNPLGKDQRSTVVAAVSKAKSGKATGKIVDVNKVIADLVSPDEPPISKDELLDLIAGDVPTSSLTPAQEEDVYQIYRQYHSEFQSDDAGSSRPIPKVSASPARSQSPATRVDSTPAAKDSIYCSFRSDGSLYNGVYFVGYVTSMRTGDRIGRSNLTFAYVEYSDQGDVSKVMLRSPNGALVNVPKSGS